MADRRMIHRKVVESDSFYSLSEGAQCAYMHLTINADEDGFVNNAGSIASRIKGGQAKLTELVNKRFLLKFGDVYVIKHWRMGNSLKNDRTKPPMYPGIAAAIWIRPNRSYTDHPVEGCKTLLEVKTGTPMESKRNPDGIQTESQGGIRLESQQNRTEQNRTEPNRNEMNSTEPNRTEATDGVEELFFRIWDAYPPERRGRYTDASKAFKSEWMTSEDVDTALENLREWKRSEQWIKEAGQYIPYLSNWLQRGIWRTRPAKYAVPIGASGELGEAEIEAIRRVLAMEPV